MAGLPSQGLSLASHSKGMTGNMEQLLQHCLLKSTHGVESFSLQFVQKRNSSCSGVLVQAFLFRRCGRKGSKFRKVFLTKAQKNFSAHHNEDVPVAQGRGVRMFDHGGRPDSQQGLKW